MSIEGVIFEILFKICFTNKEIKRAYGVLTLTETETYTETDTETDYNGLHRSIWWCSHCTEILLLMSLATFRSRLWYLSRSLCDSSTRRRWVSEMFT